MVGAVLGGHLVVVVLLIGVGHVQTIPVEATRAMREKRRELRALL